MKIDNLDDFKSYLEIVGNYGDTLLNYGLEVRPLFLLGIFGAGFMRPQILSKYRFKACKETLVC